MLFSSTRDSLTTRSCKRAIEYGNFRVRSGKFDRRKLPLSRGCATRTAATVFLFPNAQIICEIYRLGKSSPINLIIDYLLLITCILACTSRCTYSMDSSDDFQRRVVQVTAMTGIVLLLAERDWMTQYVSCFDKVPQHTTSILHGQICSSCNALVTRPGGLGARVAIGDTLTHTQ